MDGVREWWVRYGPDDLREVRKRNQPMLTALAFTLAFGLLAYGAALIIQWGVSTAMPITGRRITDVVLWRGVLAVAAAGALVAVSRMDAPEGGRS